MTEIASPGQLRWAFVRLAIVTVPLVLALGGLSNQFDAAWYAALAKPALTPPPITFGIVWPILYVLMGLALAMVWHARGNPWRRLAVILFAVQLLLNMAWSPLFFGFHQIAASLGLIMLLLAAVAWTAVMFYRVRPWAGLLLVPYLAWLCFALYLNHGFWRLNPEGAGVAVVAAPVDVPLQ